MGQNETIDGPVHPKKEMAKTLGLFKVRQRTVVSARAAQDHDSFTSKKPGAFPKVVRR